MDGTERREVSTKRDAMHRIASLIVRFRTPIFVLFALVCIYCLLSLGRVKVNSDFAVFLPVESETRRGIAVMSEEFTTFASASVMVSNVTWDMARAMAEDISVLEHVTDVGFDDSEAHFVHSSALFSVSFDGGTQDPGVVADMESIRERVAPYDHYIVTEVGGDYNHMLAQEMGGVFAIALVVILAVLLFTSRSYFEVVIFGAVFAVAALLNMGTNFWLGEISSITNAIAVIMQLALAIDYAIIFSHLYQDEAAVRPREREALIEALAKTIAEISSSSLTTVAGLVALTLMQFRLGRDLGLVLAKGILCSMLTVFLLMPGLIRIFPRALRRTAHRKLIPDIRGWGRFLVRSRVLFILLFAILLPLAVYCSERTEFAFADSSITELVYEENRAAMHKIHDTFAPSTGAAILVPAGEYEKEKTILREAEALPEIKSAFGLAGIPIDDQHVLTDGFTPRMLAELMNLDQEQARLLFQAYGLQHGEYQAILNPSEYEVPLIDLLLYLFEKMDQGLLPLEGERLEELRSLRESLERAAVQLRGETWDRLVFTTSLPVEGEESAALVETLRSLAERQYGAGSILVVGEITIARDLRASYEGDSRLISLLTILFVFLILLFTFRSPVTAILLVFVIQGSIWLNFSCSWLMHTCSSFVTHMIVSAIQMGATIDYAIVITSRFQTLRTEHPPREAMVLAVNESFPTVLTSGSILSVAGLLIACRVSDVYVGHIGLLVGRGAIISILLVLTVLPQLILLFDRLIEKTTFRLPEEERGETP